MAAGLPTLLGPVRGSGGPPWAARALAAGAVPISLGLHWARRHGADWPALVWRLSWRDGVRFALVTSPAPGEWACTWVRAIDPGRYCGTASQRPSLLDGEVTPEPGPA